MGWDFIDEIQSIEHGLLSRRGKPPRWLLAERRAERNRLRRRQESDDAVEGWALPLLASRTLQSPAEGSGVPARPWRAASVEACLNACVDRVASTRASTVLLERDGRLHDFDTSADGVPSVNFQAF
ncbi:MAG: hypothetical protein JNK05_24455 [Myxococcales bacterium]|nr:hypothetical protein [Myxococcales bacterium]